MNSYQDFATSVSRSGFSLPSSVAQALEKSAETDHLKALFSATASALQERGINPATFLRSASTGKGKRGPKKARVARIKQDGTFVVEDELLNDEDEA